MTTPRHRVSAATAQMRDAAASVADASVWSMNDAETAVTLVELTRLEAQVTELKTRVAAHADDIHVGADAGASSAANWLAHATKATRAAANGAVRLGHDLDEHPLTRDALATGRVHVEQARVIIRWVDHLPDDLGPELRDKAETHLLDRAAEHDAKALNKLGKHLFEVIDPDAADAHEAKLLAAEEKAATRKCHLKVWDDGHGSTHLRGTIPTFEGAALKKILQALMAPKHVAATKGAGATAERAPTPEAMGQAFCELITRYPTSKLPKTGGINATLLVLIDEDALLGRVEKAGVLDTGDTISPSLARRLACEAGIIPLVLGGDSLPLDIGREKRLHTRHQRIAMFVRDRGCRADGCHRLTGLHAHHQEEWANGGPTTVNKGVSLCPWHHARAHDPTYKTTYHPNGDVEFHRRV